MHPRRMVSPYTPNLHSCADVQLGGKDLNWDALYGLLRSVHTKGLLRALAVATAWQQTRLSAQGWAAFMAGPFWGHDDCSQGCRSSGIWPCDQIGVPSQSWTRLHVVLQPPLLPKLGNEASTPTHRH